MLTRGSSKARDWAVFVLAASLPAVALGMLALRALANEDAATRREMGLQLAQAADQQRQAFLKELERLGVAELPTESADGGLGEWPAAAPFAEPVVLSADGQLRHPRATEATQPVARADPECAGLAATLSGGGPEAQTARQQVLKRCTTGRTKGGRLLWPLVALDGRSQPQRSAAEIGVWLDQHAHLMGAAERAATRLEVQAAQWLAAADRDELLAAVGSSPPPQSPVAIYLAPRLAAIETGQADIVWREARSLGRLGQTPQGDYTGYVVHIGSLARAARGGWPALEPSMTATFVTGPHPPTAPHVELLAGGAYLSLAWTDPDAVARQTQRAHLILMVVAICAALVAIALAALLFARMRAARRLSALRTDFVAAVSHELRTPIASVRMLAELLDEDRVEPDERAEVHQALAREARRLGDTVDRLLSFSRMEAKKLSSTKQIMPVAPVVGEAIDTFLERHPDAGPIERQLAEGVEAPIDDAAIRMAVGNLLSNARKYAPQGQPYEVSVAPVDQGIAIAVGDRGPGISRQDQRRIFRPFERADDRLSEATEGAGIGLSLVGHVARSHGGTVRVDSEPGHGATFILWLPGGDDA
ncbi:MAG: HAMP domain-containing histidine kinase [Deltaproteobacteria bacterium]|nr:HAMP domain-containing histidine kinase [Deltaproteobacteria bacterium]